MQECTINPLFSENPKTGSFAKSEDPDEMQHNAAFHQHLHCLPRLKQPLGTEHHNLEKSTCDPLKCTIGSPILIVSSMDGQDQNSMPQTLPGVTKHSAV